VDAVLRFNGASVDWCRDCLRRGDLEALRAFVPLAKELDARLAELRAARRAGACRRWARACLCGCLRRARPRDAGEPLLPESTRASG
jgi:hypothetical protein